MRTRWRTASAKGFTLVEAIVIVAIVGLAVTVGFPLLQNYLNRAKVEGAMRRTMVLFRQARYEAIRESRTITVQADQSGKWIDIYWDQDGDNVADPGETVQSRYFLPGGIEFKSHDSAGLADTFPTLRTVGTSAYVDFNNDGSVLSQGAIRLGDQRANFVEVDISPAATAKVTLRKWDASESAWITWGEEGKSWKWY